MSVTYDMPCAHGSDDPDECWGCRCGEPIGPHPVRKRREVRMTWPFVESAAALGFVPPLPLAPAPPSGEHRDDEGPTT